MGYTVTYHCPRCEALVELEREGVSRRQGGHAVPVRRLGVRRADDAFEHADGVRFASGDDGTLTAGEDGCGEPFSLPFVRFVDGEELDPRRPSEHVELAAGDDARGPGGPSGPDGPSGPTGGFD